MSLVFRSIFTEWRLWFAPLFLLASSALLPSQAGAVNGPTLGDDVLQLVFDLPSGTVRHWYLTSVMDTTGAMHDLAAPAGQLFALRGTLGGRTMAEWESQLGGWVVQKQNRHAVTLRLSHPNGIFIIDKHWRLSEGPWRATLELTISAPGLDNSLTSDPLWLEVGPGVGEIPSQGLGAAQDLYSFTEVVYQDGAGVHRLRLDENNASATGDWFGLHSRYFALILSPASTLTRTLHWQTILPEEPQWYPQHPTFETRLAVDVPLPVASDMVPAVYRWNVFGGGKSYMALTAAEPDVGGLLFSGLWDWMRALTVGIMHLLNAIYTAVGNWGLSIILLAVLVRLLLHPFARNAMHAQQRFVELQGRIQPELDAIKKDYRGGEQSERILQLYERHQISPFAGLKPLVIVLLQLPVFIALFQLLGQVFEISSAPFLWITTLAEPDKLLYLGVDLPLFGAYFNLLPVLMAATTLLSIKLAPTPTVTQRGSRRQKFIFLGMGLSFFLLFYSFPSGMVLYWVTANLLQVMHQKFLGSTVNLPPR